MKATWLTGMLVGTALICAPHPSLAQDKGRRLRPSSPRTRRRRCSN